MPESAQSRPPFWRASRGHRTCLHRLVATFHVKHAGSGSGEAKPAPLSADSDPRRSRREVAAQKAPIEGAGEYRGPPSRVSQGSGETIRRAVAPEEVDPLGARDGDALGVAEHLGQIAEGSDVDAPVRLGRPAPPVLLQPAAGDRDVPDPELPDRSLEKARLLLPRLEDREPGPGPDDRERNARESSAAADVEGGRRCGRLDIDGIQRIEDVPGVEDGAIASRHQGELSYLGVDELAEP